MDENEENLGDTVAAMFGEEPDAPSDAHPLLTNAELEALRAEAREKVLKEQKAAAKAKALEEEIAAVRREFGEGGSDLKTDKVTIFLDLAEFCPSLTINGCVYFHGQSYTVERHVADSMREQMYRGWLHQREIDNKSLVQFYEKNKRMGDNVRSLNQGRAISMKTGAVSRNAA